MLTPAEQEKAAAVLSTLYQQLSQFETEILFRDLPAEVQKNVRAIPLIGSITSSGLEHVYQIMSRIDVAVYRLRSQMYETDGQYFYRSDEEDESQLSAPKSEPAPEPTLPAAATPSPPLPIPENSTVEKELSFGPFDPRKGMQ